jgi:hypothetical protein
VQLREGTVMHEFEATIEQGRGGGAFVAVPFDVEEVSGTKGRVPVVATFDGEVYRGSIAPMGGITSSESSRKFAGRSATTWAPSCSS